jgi:hypothetical protein
MLRAAARSLADFGRGSGCRPVGVEKAQRMAASAPLHKLEFLKVALPELELKHAELTVFPVRAAGGLEVADLAFGSARLPRLRRRPLVPGSSYLVAVDALTPPLTRGRSRVTTIARAVSGATAHPSRSRPEILLVICTRHAVWARRASHWGRTEIRRWLRQ